MHPSPAPGLPAKIYGRLTAAQANAVAQTFYAVVGYWLPLYHKWRKNDAVKA